MHLPDHEVSNRMAIGQIGIQKWRIDDNADVWITRDNEDNPTIYEIFKSPNIGHRGVYVISNDDMYNSDFVNSSIEIEEVDVCDESRCHILYDKCADVAEPCGGHGTCIDSSCACERSYSCRCEKDYAGDRCQTKSPCSPNPCLHDGHCQVLDHGDEIDYRCF